MDMLGVINTKPSKSCTRKKDKLKVVYISSPMKVKTSASRFRALVQELTGRDSDISRYDAAYFDPVAPTTSTDNRTTSTCTQVGSAEGCAHSKMVDCSQHGLFTGSESFLDDVFSSEMVDQLEGMLPSLYEPCLQLHSGYPSTSP